jgi:ribose transport system ATP-binding protein
VVNNQNMSLSPILELSGISKRFGGVTALTDVSLQVGRGEIVALIGENGAGKSTLMKVLGGVYQPDAGEIRLDGRLIRIPKVAGAVAMGIGFVHQELSNLDNLNVAGNIFIGREPLWGGPLRLIDQKKIVEQSVPHLRRLGLQIDPHTPLASLSIAQRQLVEIAKALSQNARILVLDEPTSSLTAPETETLLGTLRELKSQRVSIIYISHRLPEISQIADRVVALRDGRNAGGLERQQITHDNMVRLMIGRDLRSFYVQRKAASDLCPMRLRVRDLRTRAWPATTVSFNAAGGEILGFAGLVGAGRTELMEAIFGVVPKLGGEISLDGQILKLDSPRQAISSSIYLAPEDRRRNGVIGDMCVRENITLPGLRSCSTLNLISRRAESKRADSQISSLQIKTPSRESRAANLSGGNQQKVVLAKWLALQPKVLIVDEPTRGIDVGAKAEIYRLLRALADEGVAIIVVSSDMEEVLGISDRIAVLHEGAIAGILRRDEFAEETVMNLAFGRPIEANNTSRI